VVLVGGIIVIVVMIVLVWRGGSVDVGVTLPTVLIVVGVDGAAIAAPFSTTDEVVTGVAHWLLQMLIWKRQIEM
jgi:hypothetical protein